MNQLERLRMQVIFFKRNAFEDFFDGIFLGSGEGQVPDVEGPPRGRTEAGAP